MKGTTISFYQTETNYQIKLQSYDWELNVHFLQEEFFLLKNIRQANWDKRNSIKAGKSANASVYWAFNMEREMVTILIGEDDECWDFGVFIPITEFESGYIDFIQNRKEQK